MGGSPRLAPMTSRWGLQDRSLGYAVYRVAKAVNLNIFVNIFLVAFVADLFTYVITAIQLAAAFPATHGGFLVSFETFFAIYAVTQVPLAIVEGLLIALVFKYIVQSRGDILVKLKVLTTEQVSKIMESFA